MKSVEQIVAKIAQKGFETDFFGWGTADLMQALPYEQAKAYLKEEYINDEEEANWTYLKTEEDVLKAMVDYVPFAQGKIDDERGLSADRSCQHFIAWAWLIDEDFSNELVREYENNYAPYGQPVLDKVIAWLKEKR